MSLQSRTLVLGLNYPPESTGISNYTGALSRGLVERGHAVRALTAHPHYPDWKLTSGYGQWSRSEQIDGVAVTRLLHYVPQKPDPLPRAASETSFGARQILRRWGRPTAIVAVSPALISSAMTRLRALITHPRTPFVVWVQDLYGLGIAETGQGSGLAAKAIARLERWLLRSATHVVVIHQRFKERAEADCGVPEERISVVRNWTHLPAFPAADVSAVRAARGWSPDDTIVLHAGNMGIKQGLHHVVDAARLAQQRGERVRFVLVGNGSQREELQRAALAAPAAIEFLPSLDERDFTDVLQAADVLLVNELPGVSEMAVPSKLTSYFAAGRPVLAATDESGITASEVNAANAGVVVAAGDPDAILAGALALRDDPAVAADYGANGKRYRETVLNETFALDRFDSLLADLIADAAEKHP